MRLITRCTRSITAAKSASPLARQPSCAALRSSLATRAERSSALDGTQPRFRQSPPIWPFSIRVTRACRAAAR
ncbi:hypothetical protein D3C81_1174350 [compost metagenome]